MSHSYYHAVSSAKKHGGRPEDYLHIHNWFDECKAWVGDNRHRAYRHHSEGIFLCEQTFGTTIQIQKSDGIIKHVPVRVIGEQHVIEDCGFIPSAKEYFTDYKPLPWMRKVGTRLGSIQSITEEKTDEIY
jgi:hypothetical protein